LKRTTEINGKHFIMDEDERQTLNETERVLTKADIIDINDDHIECEMFIENALWNLEQIDSEDAKAAIENIKAAMGYVSDAMAKVNGQEPSTEPWEPEWCPEPIDEEEIEDIE